MRQHFTKGDGGGTFKKNYLEKENVKFEEFKERAKTFKISVYIIESIECIEPLEKILITLHKPSYNKAL